MAERERIVLVGAGMAGLKFLEELSAACPGAYDVTVLGAERDATYNRVLLSSLLAGEAADADLELKGRDWYGASGFRLFTEAHVAAVDLAEKRVSLTDGRWASYDRLVLATGSEPIKLPLKGAHLPEVLTFRDRADAARLFALAGPSRGAVVIGGGLLGRPYAKEWHHHILNDRSLYGLPLKFNVAFDGAGKIAALEETNDIGFQAVEVLEGHGIEPGVWWRLALGGITGHRDFARDTGVIVPLGDATKVADAIVRVFIANGDRSDRNKARLKYVLDAWGFEKFLEEAETVLGAKLVRAPAEALAPRPESERMAHIGVHRQKQQGHNWIGVSLKLGKMTCDQMRALADIAQDYGDREIRLTVWQNLLISGVRDAFVAEVEEKIRAIGLDTTCSNVRAGLVACTGNRGCKFSAADTKGFADQIATHIDAIGLVVDTPINIHATGCHHSCAQHYIGDIGLIGARVPVGEEDTVDGFNILVGGGFGTDATIARDLVKEAKGEDCAGVVERMLRGYLVNRADDAETFAAFTRRHEIEALKAMFELEGA